MRVPTLEQQPADAEAVVTRPDPIGPDRSDSAEPELTALLRGLLPAPVWGVRVDEAWAHANTDAPLPAQGWKLHVSATPASVDAVVAACVPVLVTAGCQFKIARDRRQVEWLTHANCPRENAGKILTAYPVDDAQAVALADRLDRATRGLAGPRVLSDRQLRPGSLVHYRYGAFSGVAHVSHDGEVSRVLTAPDRSTAADSRQPGVVAPPWARDPFGPVPVPVPVPAPAPGPVLLGERYAVREAIRHANRGGVFRATEVGSGRAVVVKQARAHVGADRQGVDVRDRLRHEADVLATLRSTGAVPEPIGTFEQDGDVFLVESDLGGTSLRAWVTAGMAEGLVERPWDETLAVVARLARAVGQLHAAGAVLRDLSPNNVIVTAEHRPFLVDLEFTTFPGRGDSAPTRSGTPAYSAPEQFAGADPDPSADRFSLGAILLYAFTGEDPYLGATEVGSTAAWLAHGLRRHLVPPAVAALALELCDPDPRRRPTVAEASARLPLRLPSRPALTDRQAIELAFDDAAALPDAELDTAIEVLLARLLDDVRPEPGRVARRSTFGERTLAVNVQHGAAGVLGVLVQAERTVGGEAVRERIDQVATWLEEALGADGRPGPVGLYFGWAGACWALADAGAAQGDPARVERAVEHALALPADWPGPDVTHGIAGLGLALAHLWQLTGDPRLRDAVERVARCLAVRAEHPGDGTVAWSTPRSVDSSFAGARFYGFAHGVAGIGSFLDQAALVTGHGEYADLAAAAAATLRGSAVHAGDVARWGSGPGQPGPLLAHWCNGSSGVATFLVRRPEPQADAQLLHQAARATVAAKWQSGIAYCHGLPGNADLLLDLAQRLGGPYREWAADLVRVMWRRRSEDDHGVGLTDEIGRITPDFNVGYGGALSVLLRLRHGGPRLWLPEVAR